jgi:anthranilate synthase component 1
MAALQNELHDRVLDVPGLNHPVLSGGAVGYLSFDCIRYFEPAPATEQLKDIL